MLLTPRLNLPPTPAFPEAPSGGPVSPTRRGGHLLRNLCVTFLTLISVTSAADVIDPNAFADTYNAWVKRLGSEQAGGIDVQEIQSWINTKAQFKTLQKYMDSRYKNMGYQP